jgi:hypothetical protein
MIHDFDNAIKLKGDERKAEIVERLNDYNDADLLSICREACSWDGSFEDLYAFDAEDIGDYVDTSDAYSFMCRIVFGNVENVNDMLRFDAYGHLESVCEWDLEKEARDQIDEIADWLMDNWNEAYSLYEDDKELFDAWDNIDRYGDDYYDDEEEE